jgi:hypothetical protein
MALVLEDLTSNNNDLTNNNGVTEVTTGLPFAESKACADFESSSAQNLSIADASQTGLDLTGDFTFEVWAKFEAVPDDTWQTFLGKGDPNSGGAYSWRFLRLSGVSTVKVDVGDNGTNYSRQTWSWTPTAGVWYHLALSWDASASEGGFIFYVDGASQGAGTTQTDGNVSSLYNSASAFCIGAYATSGSQSFDGQMDEVRIWSDVRTSTEINDNKSIHISPTSSGLVGYWRFDPLSNNYTKTFNETITVSDLLSKGVSRIFTETAITLSDTFSLLKVFLTEFFDNISISDTFSHLQARFKTFTETITLSDTITKIKNLFRSFADNFTISDTISFQRGYTKLFNEVITISDSIFKVLNGILVTAWSKVARSAVEAWDKVTRTLEDWTKQEKED